MIKHLRKVNGIFIGILCLLAVTFIVEGNNIGEKIFGAIFWAIPCVISLRALGERATKRSMDWCLWINYVFVAISIYLIWTFISRETDNFWKGNFSVVLGVLILSTPFVLNIIGIRRKRAELLNPKQDWPTLENIPEATDVTSNSHSVGAITPTQKSSNYIVSHWRGDQSLSFSYWINGGLIAGVLTTAFTIGLASYVNDGGYSLKLIAFTNLTLALLALVIWFWSVVGIWKSASKHKSRGGSESWASVAKFMVVMGVFGMIGRVSTSTAPQIREHFLIATGSDPLGKIDVKLATNGQAIVIRGVFREGSAFEIQNLLNVAPGVTALVLDSSGGRLIEAEKVATLVKKRDLNTYVEGNCLSACTYVFLAGKDRASTPNAKIGFHQPSFVGVDNAAQQSMTNSMLEKYRTALLPEWFIKKVGATPPTDMWYPSREELIQANVITRISLGGETATSNWSAMGSPAEIALALRSVKLFTLIETRFPGMITEMSSLVWEQKKKGANDAILQNVVRNRVSAIYPILLKKTNSTNLEIFANLFVDEMIAAQSVSIEACSKLLKGELDISQTLPKPLFEREMHFLETLLQTPPNALSGSHVVSNESPEFLGSIQKATAMMTPENVQVVMAPDKYADRPELKCNAFISLYQEIVKLSQVDRHNALSGMLQN
jgi:hypothetical protein